MSAEDERPLFGDDATATEETVVTETTTTQDSPNDPAVALAAANARADAFREMAMSRPQDSATKPAPQQQLPDNPLDLLTAAQKAELQDKFISDPGEAQRIVSTLTARLTQAKIEQQAEPLIRSQASMLVNAFKADMARIEGALYAKIAPLFDQELAREPDLRPLVNMTDAQRNGVLGRYWKAAKADVLDVQIRTAPRPEPKLLANGGVSGGPKLEAVLEDPAMKLMADHFKFTPDQIKALEEANR